MSNDASTLGRDRSWLPISGFCVLIYAAAVATAIHPPRTNEAKDEVDSPVETPTEVAFPLLLELSLLKPADEPIAMPSQLALPSADAAQRCKDQLSASSDACVAAIDCEGVTLTAKDVIPSNICAASVKFDHATILGDLDFEHSSLTSLSLRGASLRSVSLKAGTTIHKMNVENAEFKGFLEMEDASIGQLEIANTKLHSLELRLTDVEELTVRSVDVPIVVFEQSIVGKAEFEAATVSGKFAGVTSHFNQLEITHSKLGVFELRQHKDAGESIVATELKFKNVEVPSLVVERSTLARLELQSTDIKGTLSLRSTDIGEFEAKFSKFRNLELRQEDTQRPSRFREEFILDDTSLELLSLKGLSSKPLALELEKSSIRAIDFGDRTSLKWDGGTTASFKHENKLDGLLALLHAQTTHHAEDYAALEKELRDEGELADANRVHLLSLAKKADHESLLSSSWVRLLYLDGRGHPVAYLVLLAAWVLLGAWFFSSGRRNQRPAFVKQLNPPEPARWFAWKRRGESAVSHGRWVETETAPVEANDEAPKPQPVTHSDPAYSSALMSLCTLLPGDTFNYLRNYRFEPESKGQASFVIALQLLALTTQGLFLASVLSLLGR